MNALEEQLLKLAIGFVGFLIAAGSLIGYYVYRYLKVLGETKIEEAEAKRAEARATATLRLAKIGELAAASAEEQSRSSGIKGEEKAVLATAIARGLMSAPDQLDPMRADLVQTAVQAGVTKLRGSMPGSTYSFTGEQLAEVVRAASGRPPPPRGPAKPPPVSRDTLDRVMGYREPDTLPRPPRMPKEPPP